MVPHSCAPESGRCVVTARRARQLLARGFDLEEAEITGCLLEVQLRDWGLEDADLRRLVIEAIQGELPARTRRELQRLARAASRRPGQLPASLASE